MISDSRLTMFIRRLNSAREELFTIRGMATRTEVTKCIKALNIKGAVAVIYPVKDDYSYLSIEGYTVLSSQLTKTIKKVKR